MKVKKSFSHQLKLTITIYIMADLQKKRVAILATDGFEESELSSPKKAMEAKGIQADIVSLKSGEIKSWSGDNWGPSYKVDKTLSEISTKDYNALVLPGGVINPDKLRRHDEATNFIKSFFEEHKPVAAICHGPQLLAEAGVLKGRRITSFPSIKTDMMNAGAEWSDQEVVTDHGLVTSRSPEDLDAFNSKLIEEIKEGKHDMQTA